jgi:hypothetical protein
MKLSQNNSKDTNALLNGLGESIYTKVVHCKSTKEIWDKIQNIYEGDSKVKEAKLQTYRGQFEQLKCWQVYRKSVLVIDGKNNNNDVYRKSVLVIDGKNNNNDGMITGRKCQAGTRSLLGRRRRASSRSSEEIVSSCTQSASVPRTEVNFIAKAQER